MNKIAIISDIHSNIFALAEFIKITKGEIDKIYCCGDIIGYYPYQEDTIELLNKYNIISVRGNHDKYITDISEPKNPNKMLEKSIIYGRKKLTKKTKDFIKRLPDTLKFKQSGVEIAIFHGLFEDCEMRVCEKTLEVYFQKKDNLAKAADFNFFGHTHTPFIKRKFGKVFINAGSIGYPRDSSPSYVIFDLDKKEIKKYHFKYSIEQLRKDIKKLQINDDYKKMLLSPL